MSEIRVSQLQKVFKVAEKKEGFGGFITSIFKRNYKEIKAVDRISFEINEGELVGFIGPNGAGKTTTLKMLSGILYPTAGDIFILGHKPWLREDNFLKKISLVMGQKNQLIWNLPPIDTFSLNKEIYEISDKTYKQTLDELIELLELEDVLNIQVRKLSLGQRMKCELAASLIHRPKILFLDEPTIGLDVVMQKKVREFIKEYNKKYNATILLTSHYMEDVKELCKRIIIIDKGQLVYDGDLSEINKNYAPYKILKVVFAKDFDLKKLESIGEVKEIEFPKAEILVKRDVSNAAAAELLHSFPVDDLNIEEIPIEEVVRKIFSGK